MYRDMTNQFESLKNQSNGELNNMKEKLTMAENEAQNARLDKITAESDLTKDIALKD